MKKQSASILLLCCFFSMTILFTYCAKGRAKSVYKSSTAKTSEPDLSSTSKSSSAQDQDFDVSIENAKKLATSDKYRINTPRLLTRIRSADMKPLPLKAQDISVVITGHKSRVVYDLIFQNPYDRQLAGQLMLELPDGASPCYLGMFQGRGVTKSYYLNKIESPLFHSLGLSSGNIQWLNPLTPDINALLAKEIKLPQQWRSSKYDKVNFLNWGEQRSAKVTSPVKGRRVYESIVRRRIDPALSEWHGVGKFKTRIFPIPGQGYKRIVFAYDLPLQNRNGSVLHRLPLPKETKAQTRINLHLLGQQMQKSVVIAGNKTIQPMKMSYGSTWQIIPDKNLRGSLIFQGQYSNPKWQLMVGRDNKIPGKLVHLRFQPQLPDNIQSRPTGKAMFVLDTSYSTKSKIYAKSGKLLRAILQQDKTISHFAVIGFDVCAREITKGFVKNTEINRRDILAKIENIWLEGASNFSSVLKTLKQSKELSQADSYFLLSDGIITWGVDNLRILRNKYAKLIKKRWLCYFFAQTISNRDLFSTLGRNQGQLIHIALGQDINKAALAHRRVSAKLDAVSFQNSADFALAGDPKWIYPGQLLEIALKVPDEQKKLHLNISINGHSQKAQIPLNWNKLNSNMAARSWADLYAHKLLANYDDKADEIVLALSRRFSLSNRAASFIILETDREYAQHNININSKKEMDLTKLAQLTRTISNKPSNRKLTALKLKGLKNLNVIQALGDLPTAKIWRSEPLVNPKSIFEMIINQPKGRTNNKPWQLYKWAKELYKNNSPAKALRVISTVIELNPNEVRAARMVAFILMEWQLYQEAESLFARIRYRRPFEPQNFLLEALALTAQGKIQQAAIRYEIVLQRKFSNRHRFAKTVAQILYAELLTVVFDKNKQFAAARIIQKRIGTLPPLRRPRGKLFFFWNVDDSFVSIRVSQPDKTELDYRSPSSNFGGSLRGVSWGLGPVYYEHPTLDNGKYHAFVDYYRNWSAEGGTPVVFLIGVFNDNPYYDLPKVKWHTSVLSGTKKGRVKILSNWEKEE